MPRCTWATFPADIFLIMRNAPSTRSGRLSRVVLPINFGTMLSKKGSVPRFQHVSGGLQARRSRLWRISRRFRVASTPAPPPARDIAARTQTAHSRRSRLPPEARVRFQRDRASWHEIGGMLFHGSRAFARFRFTVSPQIRQDQLIARSQSLGGGQPEFMMDRKRVEQHYRRHRCPTPGTQSPRRRS